VSRSATGEPIRMDHESDSDSEPETSSRQTNQPRDISPSPQTDSSDSARISTLERLLSSALFEISSLKSEQAALRSELAAVKSGQAETAQRWNANMSKQEEKEERKPGAFYEFGG